MSTYFNQSDNGNTHFQKLNTLEDRVKTIEDNGASPASGVTEDVPKTLGEYYCVRKAQEMIATSAYLTNSMTVPQTNETPNTKTLPAGDSMSGVPYSSTKKYNGFVPNHVSFESFFTALSDPNSNAYLVHPHSGVHEYLYYGLVCTEFVCHCLGIKPIIHTNGEMFGVDGIELVEQQDAQAMHIGYIINVQNRNGRSHVEVCIGVKRNNGVVTHVTLAECTGRSYPNCRAVEYTAQEFNALLNTFTILKYNKLEENTYEPLMSSYKMPIYNKNIMPAKGNKSNWSDTESVVVNVLDAGSYTDYIVYRDGVQHSTASFSGSSINLGVLPWGKYSMVLTDGTNKSAPVEWIVVDMHMTATARSGEIVRFSFSSLNAVPVACCWAYPGDFMIYCTYKVTKEDIQKGYKDTSLSTDPWACNGVEDYSNMGSQYAWFHNVVPGNGTIRPRMFFETEFGIITTDPGTSSNNVTLLS